MIACSEKLCLFNFCTISRWSLTEVFTSGIDLYIYVCVRVCVCVSTKNFNPYVGKKEPEDRLVALHVHLGIKRNWLLCSLSYIFGMQAE